MWIRSETGSTEVADLIKKVDIIRIHGA
jgi:hypothetical protein